MSEEMIVLHCSPTLAGMKTANMFTVPYESREEMNSNLRKWNKILKNKGLRAIPLRYRNKKALIYIYRHSDLARDLSNSLADSILREKGYGSCNTEQCIKKLIKELSENDEFPHEIGLFLGYPPEDVHCYMEHREDALKCVGCWRVYTNEESAKKTFCKYKKCTKVYSECLSKGTPFERLVLAG